MRDKITYYCILYTNVAYHNIEAKTYTIILLILQKSCWKEHSRCIYIYVFCTLLFCAFIIKFYMLVLSAVPKSSSTQLNIEKEKELDDWRYSEIIDFFLLE